MKINLQLFAESEYEDFILPDEVEETSQPEEEVGEPAQEEVQEEQPEEEEPTTTQTEPEETQMVKVKFNHEEQEIPLDEAVPLIQKGMNYDKVQERLNSFENDPRISLLNDIANEEGLTTEQLVEQVRQQREQAKLDSLIQQNIPEELAKEILEGREFRQKWKEKEKEQQAEEKQKSDLKAFVETYPDVKPEDIPQEVWQEVDNGKSLVDAYTRHENQQLKNQLKMLQQQKENNKKAPVKGVTGHGSVEPSVEDDFLKGFNSI